jgi:hypothetical protein
MACQRKRGSGPWPLNSEVNAETGGVLKRRTQMDYYLEVFVAGSVKGAACGSRFFKVCSCLPINETMVAHPCVLDA